MEKKEGEIKKDYEIKKEAGEDVAYLDFSKSVSVPSISESPGIMAKIVEVLMENPNVSRVVLSHQKGYNYGFKSVSYLSQIANLYNYFLNQKEILSIRKLAPLNNQLFPKRYNSMLTFLELLKQDPIAAYINLKGILITSKIKLKNYGTTGSGSIKNYIFFLSKIIELVKELDIIKDSSEYMKDYHLGEREIYDKLLKSEIIPSFTQTRLISHLSDSLKMIDQYKISGKYKENDYSVVTIFEKKGESKFIYHIVPPENSLKQDYYTLLNLAKKVLIEHQPKAEEFVNVEKIRRVFFNISKNLLQDLSKEEGINVNYSDLDKLATILVRNTVGFGLLEVLLQDEKIQDISLNAPMSQTQIFIIHQDYGECVVNIIPSTEDENSWAAKFRILSGRPLDEANPILDTQLSFDKIRARVSAIQKPLSPNGISYSIRRHRDSPWTLPLFIENKMINPLAAGLLSFLIDGSRTFLIGGTRSSGKTSLLSSFMLEILSRYRIIVIEDSLELPIESFRKLGYDILSMKVRSALLKTGNEVSADDGIRTSLRLGDSVLIVGEVRSVEAKALYEAMRVGALANVVAGTIHGASPYSVFDRVVNDLGVPVTSFKATDIITIANPIKTPDGLHSMRRVLQIAEVRKKWKKDPLEERGFVNLLNYNIEKDELEPSEDLINGDSEILKDIASKIKGWAGNWDAVYDNVLLRAKIKKELVDTAKKTGNHSILEDKFSTLANYSFHKISESIRKEIGVPQSKQVFPLWQKWLNEEIKKKII